MADAEKSGSAYMQLNTFLTIYGDKAAGWDKFKGVFNNLNVSASSGAVPRFVNDGEAVVGITLEDNAYLYLKGGGPVAIVYPEDGTSAIADGMALCKRAPNPAAGKAFQTASQVMGALSSRRSATASTPSPTNLSRMRRATWRH